MPRVAVGATLVEVANCPYCDRTVYVPADGQCLIGVGYLAACGRRLVNIAECGSEERCRHGHYGETVYA